MKTKSAGRRRLRSTVSSVACKGGFDTAWSWAARARMGFTAVSDVISSLCGVLSGKAPHLPVTFAPGQQHLLDYGGCHLSSLSLTVKDSPALLTKWWEDWVWSRNSLQAFLTKSDFRGGKGGWERGKDCQRPTATTFQPCTEGWNLHEEWKVEKINVPGHNWR